MRVVRVATQNLRTLCSPCSPWSTLAWMLRSSGSKALTPDGDFAMKTNKLGAMAIVIALSAAGSYALAEPKPAPAKPANAPATPAAPACDPASCPKDCDMQGMGKHGGMKMGMHECPMMEEGMPAMTVSAENTKQGATLTLKAKNPAEVAKLQEMAQKMAKHMEAGGCMGQGAPGGAGSAGHQHGHGGH